MRGVVVQVLAGALAGRVQGADRSLDLGAAVPVPVDLPSRRMGMEAPDAVMVLDLGVIEEIAAAPAEAVGGVGVGPEDHPFAGGLAAVGADLEGGRRGRGAEPEHGEDDQRCEAPAHSSKVERAKAGIFGIFLARANASGRPMLHNPASMIRRGGITVAALAALAAFALPAVSATAATGPPTLELNGPKSPGLLDKVTAIGNVPGATAGANVTVEVQASGNTVEKKQLTVGGDGKFSFPFVIDACCDYVVTATSGGQSSQPQRFTVRVPKHLRKGAISHLYNQSLVDEGYYTGGHVSGKYNHGSQLATLAFRKVNNMARNYQYKPVIFEKLLQGRGGFHPRYHSGHHVEVDISRQVMALVNGDDVVATFHVSTGKPSTPTVRGTYHFYRKDPGYNSEGMYYSVYFIRGYATHGYNPVPMHEAASHGCVRNPIPFSQYIYNWINLGDAIHVYL